MAEGRKVEDLREVRGVVWSCMRVRCLDGVDGQAEPQEEEEEERDAREHGGQTIQTGPMGLEPASKRRLVEASLARS